MIRTHVVASVVALALSAVNMGRLPVAHAAPQEARTAAPSTVAVNLNSASAVELEKLPGVGPSLAARIVEYRQKNGGFKKLEDILENASSCPSLLMFPSEDPFESVSGSRRIAQQISQVIEGGGRSGGRTQIRVPNPRHRAAS